MRKLLKLLITALAALPLVALAARGNPSRST
jgi:hypothetical protein